MAKKYRSRLQIVAEILEVVRDGAKKTHIMYRANLSYRLLCRYLGEVLECGLVRVKGDDSFCVTAKGERFLERFFSYVERRKRLERELETVDDEKELLEQTYVNSEAGGGGGDGDDDVAVGGKGKVSGKGLDVR